MKCIICGKDCIDKDKNICSNCSTSGLEYRENPPVKAKRISTVKYINKNKNDGGISNNN